MTMKQDGSDQKRLIESWNQPSYDFSPDGKWIVYALEDDDYNADVWLMPTDASRPPFNLSVHPDNDRNPVWSPDGKRIAFVGRRWGTESDLVWVNLQKSEDQTTSRSRKLEKALKKMKGRKGGAGAKKSETPKKPAAPAAKEAKAAAPKGPLDGVWEGVTKGAPGAPPEGSRFVLSVKQGKSGTFTGDWESDDDSGSIENGKFDASTGKVSFGVSVEVGTLAIEGQLRGESMSGTWSIMNFTGTWSVERKSTSSAPAAAPAAAPSAKSAAKDKEPAETKIDFDGIHDRLRRVSMPNSFERGLHWSPDGKKLYFFGSQAGRSGTYSISFPNPGRPAFWSTGNVNGRWIKDGNRRVGISGGSPAEQSASGSVKSYAFSVNNEVDIAQYHLAIFHEAWLTMRDRWYDERMGNNNWDSIRRKYAPMAASLTPATLSLVVTMMLGELNGSHLGFRYGGPPRSGGNTPGWRESTAHLGLRFVEDWKGPGLKVRDVIRNSPAAREDSLVEAGELVMAIDGKSVDPGMDIATVLTGRSDREIRVSVRNAAGEDRVLTMRPTSYGAIRGALYEKWIQDNRKQVEKLSNGSMGYMHIRAMDDRSLQRFDAELYRVGHGKDGLIIDVRENGGGSITDHLLTCLTQPTHAITRARGGGEGYPQGRRVYATWDKPVVVLCNQNSFSNAEIFSHAIKQLGRGQVVGVPTAGGVISTGGAGLYGGAFIRLPFRGWYTLDGQDMELQGAVPHHVLWPQPTELPAGKDRQLEKAIEVLKIDVAREKAKPRPKLIRSTER